MNTLTVALPKKTANDVPMGDLLAYHATRNPTKLALTLNRETVTYHELDRRATARAHTLSELGVNQGDIVTISMPKSIEVYECLFAIWKLGASPNVVSERLPARELQEIVKLANPRVVIAPDAERLPGHRCLSASEFSAPDAHVPRPISAKVAASWKVMASGGSTGRPKLIVAQQPASHDPANTLMLQAVNGTILNPGPLYHNTPFAATTHCLFSGGHVIEMGRFDPLLCLQLIEQEKVDWVSLVPTMMHRIWRLPEEERASFDLSSLRVVLHMAAPCPAWLKEKWIEWLGADRIFEVYGGTEGLGFCAISGNEWLNHKGSVGRVQPGSQLRVISESGAECAPGEIGGVYFRPEGGKGSTYNYVGAIASAQGEWETYGDLGSLDAEGYLFLADRRLDMIISGGENIYPAEVEGAIDAFPAVISSIVVGLPDDDLGHKAHAIVQLAPNDDETNEERLREFLSDRIVRYKIPRSFEFTHEPLRDDAGKARRSRLAAERAQRPGPAS